MVLEEVKPLILILKLPVAVPSMYSSVFISNNSLNINQLNYFNQTNDMG